uniref:ArfGAP with SH3 domain, ankyrin repeat and PH domain 1 n=1 Tax=Rousettus aegyptiacus TaxID=9407 RepID=A0A7J8C0U0_ROUAE|nr:ArfGAP with SH3 domain, ankyrin repeat and PH domain 1 [Rousettus aegyptiacus]
MRATTTSMTSQARSRRSARQGLRASATPPASPRRTSCRCRGSALRGTSSGSPTAPSPTRSSSPRARTRPRHQRRTRHPCLLETPAKVQLAHLQHSL